MSKDDEKPPVALYRPVMRLTPNGTEFRQELTKEGREALEAAQEARQKAGPKLPDAENVRNKFRQFAKLTDKQEISKAAKKDRGDFER